MNEKEIEEKINSYMADLGRAVRDIDVARAGNPATPSAFIEDAEQSAFWAAAHSICVWLRLKLIQQTVEARTDG